ncbi:MAG: acyl transferase [Flavobacterium sp.]|nr:acyl transferase [Flavobacterium sp.]
MISNNQIFAISNQKQFEKLALKLFRFQHENNLVYKQFCDLRKVEVSKIKAIKQIPFLPIQFFKSHKVVSNINEIQEIFTSSATTGAITSQHLVTDVSLYQESYRQGFSQFYGNIEDYVVLALLPSYLDRSGSSLIYMFNDLIKMTNDLDSGFYLNNQLELLQKLEKLKNSEKQVLLIGVTFALLDLIDFAKSIKFPLDEIRNFFVMETGGMKGRRKEIIREDLHQQLCKGFSVSSIHSEYGMTELLSQAYSLGEGIFECTQQIQILIRDTEDALTYIDDGKTGGINVIDLANINSCSFIATQDLGKKYANGTFEILGRFDNSDIRGCNLMVV